jgi:hypothetical protein
LTGRVLTLVFEAATRNIPCPFLSRPHQEIRLRTVVKGVSLEVRSGEIIGLSAGTGLADDHQMIIG